MFSPEKMFDPENPPELMTSRWFNSPEPLSLQALKGRVVLLSAFQMLCPGCVEHGLPLAQKLFERFNGDEITVIGLHTVFEHHEVTGADALAAFIHEYGWKFPIAIDEAGEGEAKGALPMTMQAYQMQGTPTLLLFDRQGRLRRHYFGRPDELLLGAEVMALAIEPADASRETSVGIEKMLAASLIMPEQASHNHADDHADSHEGPDHHHDHGHKQHGHDEGCGCG